MTVESASGHGHGSRGSGDPRDRGLVDAAMRAWLTTRPSIWWSLGVGLGGCAFSTGLRVLFQPHLGPSYAFITYFLGVTLAAGIGGFGAGFVALVASALTAWLFFMPPHPGSWFAHPNDVVALGVFLITAGMEGAMAASLRLVLIRLRVSDQAMKLLADELNHRVKNSLATVLAIARQTARHTTDVAAFNRTFEERVHALANAHELVARRKWLDTDIREILHPELAAWGPRAILEGGALRLSARAALGLSMIVHELATNAAKYGALSGDKGIVDVQWRVEPGPRSDKAVLIWREAGGPVVAEPCRKGFGSTLIARVAKGDLGGVSQVEFRPEGLAVRLEFPLAGTAQ